ncbi:MAG: hypothetical protein JNL66_10360 [Alphaproteobacteria bacterium]|nr:hypothetical protein [Alphaproteobacteria bacterium]
MTPPTALPQAVDVLTGQTVPFPLRALSIDSAGRIVRRDHADAVFGFAVAGTAFRACARERAGGIQVAVEADLATLPFSAESPGARRELRELAAEARLSNGRLLVVDHRTVALSTAIDVPGPASPVDVITHLVALVLELRPYLTRIAMLAATAMPGRAAGTA